MSGVNSMSDGVNKPLTVADMIAQVRAKYDGLDQFIKNHNLGETQRRLFADQYEAELGALSVLPQGRLFNDVFLDYSRELTRRLNVGGVLEVSRQSHERRI